MAIVPEGTKSAASRPHSSAARRLERVDRLVLAVDVVADGGRRHGLAHPGRRARDGVGAQVDRHAAESRRDGCGQVAPRPCHLAARPAARGDAAEYDGRVPIAPAAYPPPFAASEVIAAPEAPADEQLEVGVAIVGGGPAGLACAIRLGQLLEGDPALAETLGEVPIALIDKGRTVGAHQLSGAVVQPRRAARAVPRERRSRR